MGTDPVKGCKSLDGHYLASCPIGDRPLSANKNNNEASEGDFAINQGIENENEHDGRSENLAPQMVSHFEDRSNIKSSKTNHQVLRHLTCPQTTKEVSRDALPTVGKPSRLAWGTRSNKPTNRPKRTDVDLLNLL